MSSFGTDSEADRKHKLAREYHVSIDTIDTPNFFKPMLAHKYDKTLDFPCYAQPKLDGIRCIATAKGLFSRQGKQIFGVPHIESALTPHFDEDASLILDGELYNHDLKDDFNQIASMVRKQSPSDEQLIQSEKLIQYHIYDCPSRDAIFSVRAEYLGLTVGRNTDYLQLVETHFIADQSSLDESYGDWLTQGYEGQMIRTNEPYQQKRSKTLLKRKEFQDQEFKLLRLEEGRGNWAGYAKRAIFELEDGREFGAGIKGNQAFTRQLLAEADKFIEKSGTVRFFALTPDGIPRFPVAVDFARTD